MLHPVICWDFIAKFHFLEKENRAFWCLSARRLKGDICWDGGGDAAVYCYERRTRTMLQEEFCIYRGWKDILPPKNSTTSRGREKKTPTGRVIRNVDWDKSSSKSTAVTDADRGGLGSFSMKLEGIQLNGTTWGLYISIICHKDKLKSCQFIF